MVNTLHIIDSVAIPHPVMISWLVLGTLVIVTIILRHTKWDRELPNLNED